MEPKKKIYVFTKIRNGIISSLLASITLNIHALLVVLL
jgi:hypothetical protein